jgi:hypothetical protein
VSQIKYFRTFVKFYLFLGGANLELPEKFLGGSKLQRPGQIDLKAKIGFQNSLAQIEFTEGCAPGQFGKETVGGASRGSGGARRE